MKIPNVAYVCAGILIGSGVVFYQVDMPRSNPCETYSVSKRVATSYALKPPPAEVIYKACPQITQKVEEAKVEEPVVEEEKPRRRHRRHHRTRRYWR